MNLIDFIAKNQPVAKESVRDAIGKMIDRLVADGTLVAEMRPTIGGEVLFYRLAERHDFPFDEEWAERQLQPLPEFSKPKASVPLTFTCIPEKQQEVKQLF